MDRRSFLSLLASIPFVRHFVAGAPELPKPDIVERHAAYIRAQAFNEPVFPRADTLGQDEVVWHDYNFPPGAGVGRIDYLRWWTYDEVTGERRMVGEQRVFPTRHDNPPAGEA